MACTQVDPPPTLPHGQAGDNVVIQLVGSGSDATQSAKVVGEAWLDRHASSLDGKTVLEVDGEQRVLPRADLG